MRNERTYWVLVNIELFLSILNIINCISNIFYDKTRFFFIYLLLLIMQANFIIRPHRLRSTTYSRVSFEWAFPGVVVSIVMPFSVSVSNAFKLLVSDIVVGVGVWMWSVDTFLSWSEGRWFVHADSGDASDQSEEFHFTFNK